MNSFRRAFVLFFLVAAVAVNAEPPRFRSNRFQFQRQEQDPALDPAQNPSEGSGSGGDAPYPPAVSAPYPPAMPAAPYPPSNWKPSGRLFALPARQTQLRETYGPPSTQLPAEPEATEEPQEEVTAEAVAGTTTEPESEPVEVEEEDKAQAQQPEEKNKSQRLTQPGPGFYYVQLPQFQQQQQQQVYVQPAAQVETAQLRQFPVGQAAQPLVIANQPLVVGTTGYYVQTW